MKTGVDQKISPIRFLLLIQPDNEDRFVRAVELAHMLWGGTYYPILPYYAELPADYRREYQIDIPTLDFYKNTIANFDPDIILYDQDQDPEFIKTFADERELITIEQYLDDLSRGRYDHAISILEIGEYLLDEEFKYLRSDGTKFSIPKLTENDLLLQAFSGSISDPLRAQFQKIYHGNPAFEEPELNWGNMDVYQSSPKIDLSHLNL